MNVSQLTDTQLMAQADNVCQELLATAEYEPGFNQISLTFDLLGRELVSRGIWEAFN